MAKILTLHKATATVGTTTDSYFFLARPSIYSGDIATQTGVSEATNEEKDEPRYPISELLAKGILTRLVTYAVSGTGTTARRKTHRLLVVKSKIGTALDGLRGKSIDGAVVDSVGFPRKRTLF
jgi:hypothetical protein